MFGASSEPASVMEFGFYQYSLMRWLYAAGYRIHGSSFILIVYWTSFAVGVPGNLLSAMVWLRPGITSRNSSAVHLGALAIVDLLDIGLSMPLLFLPWFAYRYFIHMAIYHAVLMLYYTGVAFILAVSVQRFIHYRHPSRVSKPSVVSSASSFSTTTAVQQVYLG